MTNKIPYTKTMTSAELSDEIFWTAYKIPSGEMATKREAQLWSASSTSEGVDPTELADQILREYRGLQTAAEALEATEHRLALAWRDKIRVAPCRPERRCEEADCQYCQRRADLIDLIWVARLESAGKRARKAKKKPLSLDNTSDAELADEFLYAAFGIPTLKEAQRRSNNVYRYARRKGWDIGGECDCVGHRRMHCHVCRRTQQLALMLAFLTVCDLELAWRTITIIPGYGRSELGKQPLGDLRKVVKRVIGTLLEHAPGITGMFVVEPSVNTDRHGVRNCQWHVHGIFRGVKQAEYQNIKQDFAWSDGDGRDVQSQKVTDVAGHIAYMAKPVCFSRNKYVRNNGEPSIHKYPIRTAQEALIATALGKKRISGRVFFINMGEVENIVI
ncbi:MAG: hypothetical protein ABJ050_19655 [Paracoccaceae bacterium]